VTPRAARRDRQSARRPRRHLARLAAGALLAAGASGAAAQTTIAPRESLDFDRPEAWGMKYVAAIVAFAPLASPRTGEAGAVELALEAASVPSLSQEERRIGFNGTKVEDIDRAPAFGRLRLLVGLPRGFSAELGVVPPVELDGLEPELVALALSRPLARHGRFALGARLQAQHGTLAGDITCSRGDVAGGDDPVRNPLGCEAPSRDELELTTAGGALVAALAPRRPGGLEPYFVVAAERIDGTFRVDARYSGLRDRTRLDAEGWIWSLALGADGSLGEAWRLAGELAYSPLDIRRPGRGVENEPVVNLRLVLSRRVR
jgi:hypothetical protein